MDRCTYGLIGNHLWRSLCSRFYYAILCALLHLSATTPTWIKCRGVERVSIREQLYVSVYEFKASLFAVLIN